MNSVTENMRTMSDFKHPAGVKYEYMQTLPAINVHKCNDSGETDLFSRRSRAQDNHRKYEGNWRESIARIRHAYEARSSRSGTCNLFNSTMLSRATLMEQQDDYRC